LLRIENGIKSRSENHLVVAGQGNVGKLSTTEIIISADFPELRHNGQHWERDKEWQTPKKSLHLLVPAGKTVTAKP
jgi:hypothetical protein